MGTPQCYLELNSTIAVSSWKPCGSNTNGNSPNVQCCAGGDFCLSNGLCQYSHSQVGSSGYYAGGCTDKSYKDASCPQFCNAQGHKDVVFSSRDRVWSCCGGDQNSPPHCDTPTNDNFGGVPAMNQLNTVYQAGVGAVSTTMSRDHGPPPPPPPTAQPSSPSSAPASTTSSSSSTSSATTTAPRVVIITKSPTPSASASNSSVSAGLAGGLGAGAAVIVLLVSSILFWIWRRKRKTRNTVTEITPSTPTDGSAQSTFSPVTPMTPMAFQTNGVPNEMHAKRVRHELSHESMSAAELPTSSNNHSIDIPESINEMQEMPHPSYVKDMGGKG